MAHFDYTNYKQYTDYTNQFNKQFGPPKTKLEA